MKSTFKINKLVNKGNYRRILGEVKKIDGVVSLRVNKDNNTLSIEYDNESVIEQILKAFRKYEKNVELELVINDEVYRKVLILKGIDCGQCAQRIETLAKKEFDYERVVVDFSTERFIIETKDKNLYDNLIAEVSIIAKKVDPRIIVQEMNKRQRGEDLDNVKFFKPYQLIMFIFGITLTIAFIIVRSSILGNIDWLFDGSHNDSYLYSWFDYAVIVVALILVGFQVLLDFVINLFKRHELDEKFLMSVASVGAIITNHVLEAILVMVLYQVGKFLQDLAVNHSRKSIKALLSFEATSARLKVDDKELEVDVESILPNDVLIVKTGEMIPVDGVVVNGKSHLDLKALTGEMLGQNVKAGDNVRSGSINLGNVLEIKAKKIYRDSTMNQILDMVENASSNKAKSENFITQFAKIYTPVVVSLASIVGIIVPLVIALIHSDIKSYPALLIGSDGWIYKAMVFLVIACPCALVISVPLAFFGGIGLSSKRGILVKGSNYLEALDKTQNVLFDKTGTITKGEFSVKSIVSLNETISTDEIKRLVAYAEYHSTHPIGISITDNYGRENIFPDLIDEFVHSPGIGVRAVINGSLIRVINYKRVKEDYKDFKEIKSQYLVLYVVKDKQIIGYIEIGDTIKDEAKEFLNRLDKQGISRVALLTGDNKSTSQAIANELGIKTVHSELLPNDKVKILEKYKSESTGKTIYIGDGINDAPVISSADVGIAVGRGASEGAIAIADVVIMDDNLLKVNEIINISHFTKRIVYENIIFALFFKTLVLVITFFNIPSMIWLAIFSDVGVSLLAILNSLRIPALNQKRGKKNE